MFCPFLENKLSFVLLEAASNCDSSDKHVQLMNVRLNLTMYCLFVKFFPTLFIFLSSPVIKTTFDHDPIRSNKRSFVKYVEKCHWNYVSFKSNEYRISSTKRSRILYKIPPMQKKKKKKKKMISVKPRKQTGCLFIWTMFLKYTLFYKQHFYEENLAETGKK